MRRIVPFIAIALAACSSYPAAPVQPDEKTYSGLYPYYVEQCAVSEINKTAQFGATIESGGPGGHSLLYLSGVCRDTSGGYPVLKMCDDSVPLEQRGVGLSVNDHFQNANWVATQGRDFFFHGTVKPGEGLTRESYDATVAQAQAQKIYDGVRFHDEVYAGQPATMSRQDYDYDISIGTDFAPDFARNRLCSRAPVSKEQMQDAVRYLNRLNAPYRAGEKEFHWDVLRDNCTHMVHNTVAAAGVWDAWPHNDSMILAALNFPVPKNEFVNLMRHTNDMDLNDLDALYADRTIRDGLMHYGFLPDEPGALAEFSSVIAPNDIYSTHSRLIFFDEGVLGTYEPRLRDIFLEPRYTDLRSNLLYFSDLYRRVEAGRKPMNEYAFTGEPGFKIFYSAYFAYIERMKRQTDADIDLIDSAAVSRQ